MMAENKKRQVVVIGAGPGGYAAAFLAADLGLETTLVDPEAQPGGVCLYRGCIPSKALLHLSSLRREAREAADFGLNFSEAEVDLDKVRSWKNGVVDKLTGGLRQLAKQRKIDYIQGKASFEDAQTLAIAKNEGDTATISFENAILATGSRPVSLPGADHDSARIIFSKEALDLKEIPDTMLVIGGGYIGLEMGTVYAELGSKVSVVEMTAGFLPGTDEDLVKVFAKKNKDRFETVKFETKVTNLKEEKEKEKVKVTLEDKNGKTEEKSYDKVLVAVGRQPLTAEIGLENTRVELDDRGFVKVNAQRRTAESSIYAIGDITGEPMLAHKATHEGRVAAEAIAGKKTGYEPRSIPAVVYTDPEIAWCGLTEKQAKEAGENVKIAKFPWSASGRAATLGRSDGLTKLIIAPESDRILGVGIAGKDAGNLIAEGALAVEMAALASDLALTIHPHPTLSETLMEAAEAYYGHPTHIYRKSRHGT